MRISDWSSYVCSSDLIARRIRAFNPAPVAWTELDGERVRILAATADASTASRAASGTVVSTDAGEIAVASGDGVVRLQQLQWPGGKALPAAEIIRNRPLLQRRFA